MGMEKIAKYVERGNVNKDVGSQDDGIDQNSLSKENIVSHKMHRVPMWVAPLVSESEKPVHEMWSRLGLSGKRAGSTSSKSVEPAPEESNSSHVDLLDSCLKSPFLPAFLAAAFAKKLSRLALSVPPSGSLVLIAIIHNLLRRHPSINCLVHRESVAAEADDAEEKAHDIDASSVVQERKRGVDPFKFEESDPMKSDPMRSSLWEIDTLCHHYCAAASRFMLPLETDLNVRAKTTEMSLKDFSSGSYGTIFKNEIGRRRKQVPRAFYKALSTSLF